MKASDDDLMFIAILRVVATDPQGPCGYRAMDDQYPHFDEDAVTWARKRLNSLEPEGLCPLCGR